MGLTCPVLACGVFQVCSSAGLKDADHVLLLEATSGQ